jgi:hypothetical protein
MSDIRNIGMNEDEKDEQDQNQDQEKMRNKKMTERKNERRICEENQEGSRL